MAVIKYKDSNGDYHRIEVPTVQRAVMPSAESMPLGAVVQYTGATTGDFVNGYFYKIIETSTTVQVNYYGYAQGSGDYRTDLFSKEGQTEGYYYSSTTSASTMKNFPNFTPLDGSKYTKNGNVYDFADAPNMAESRVYPFVSGSTSTTMYLRLKNGSSYSEASNTVTLERKSSIDTTREETVTVKVWQQINVQPSSAGEAESYNDLTDKPAINGHALGGNLSNAALGIGERMDFSTTERVIGTWIDGDTIYEKVFTITGFTQLVKGTPYVLVSGNDATNINKIIYGLIIAEQPPSQDPTLQVWHMDAAHMWNNKYSHEIKAVPQFNFGEANAPLREVYLLLRYTKVTT